MSWRLQSGGQLPKDIREYIHHDISRQKRIANIQVPDDVLRNTFVALHHKTLLTEFELQKLVEKYYIRSGGQSGNEAAKTEDGSSSFSARHS